MGSSSIITKHAIVNTLRIEKNRNNIYFIVEVVRFA